MMNKHNGSGPKREVIDINSQTVPVYSNLLVSKRSSRTTEVYSRNY